VQKLILAILTLIVLNGCGGSSSGSSQTLPDSALPTTPCENGMECMDNSFTNPHLPIIPTEPSDPVPTTPCNDGSCLDDNGFTNPHLPVTPTEPSNPIPTTPCSDGSCLEDNGFTNPSLPNIPVISPEVVNIAGFLGWDVLEVNTLCTATDVQCVLDEENDVVIKVSDNSYHDSHISEYRPIRKEVTGQAQYRSPDTMIENVILNIEKSSTPETCNKVGIWGPGKFRVSYGPFYPDDSVLLEWSTLGKTTNYYPCYYTQETNLGPVGGPPGPNTVYYFSPSANVSSNLSANIILGKILYEHR